MKRVTAVLLALCMALSLSACGKAGDSSSDDLAQSSSGAVSTTEDTADSGSESAAEPAGPAPEVNLVTGEPLAEGQQAGGRPVAILVNNAQAAMPQRGIGSANAIFEMVTEGGITRMMALYSDRAHVPQTGPVRSARDQFVQFAIPLNSLIVHIGASIYAENLLTQYHYPTIDGMYLGATSFRFDESRKAAGYKQEHCWYTDSALIAAGMTKNGISGDGAARTLFHFVPAGTPLTMEGPGQDVSFSFSGSVAVTLHYDAALGRYLKTAFGAPQIDESTGEQLGFENVILLFTDISLKNPDDPNNLVTDFAMTGGDGYYIRDGQYQSISWRKGNPEDELKLYDASGAELDVLPGKSYVAVVGNDRANTLVIQSDDAASPDSDEPET